MPGRGPSDPISARMLAVSAEKLDAALDKLALFKRLESLTSSTELLDNHTYKVPSVACVVLV